MSKFRFKRLERYKVGGTRDKMELNIPLPHSPSGKVYRWCPNDSCKPRLFLIGDGQRPTDLDISQFKRPPGPPGTTCPYCNIDADDSEFNYDGDITAIKRYLEWAVVNDMRDQLADMAKGFNHRQPRRSLISMRMEVSSSPTPRPHIWREDLLRNLACDTCGREYGVYAIALFCPDCGSKNLHVHFEREVELVLKQVELAERMAEEAESELSYRILGNAHEDVLTAFETYQKVAYKYMINATLPPKQAAEMISKRAIGNRFQNIDRARKLYRNLNIDPLSVLHTDELDIMRLNIEKRHVIGHNLSLADEHYATEEDREDPGTTVQILADEIQRFAEIAQKIIVELERLM